MLSDLAKLIQQAEYNPVLIGGDMKKAFVLNGIKLIIGPQAYGKQTDYISNTVDALVTIANNPEVLNFASRVCCFRKKW